MGLIVGAAPRTTLAEDVLQAWARVPTAIISDELNRFACPADLSPVGTAGPFAGPALTVQLKAGDNAALHYAVADAPKGSVLVIDAAGHTRTAVWGGILHRAAEVRGIRAVVVDGAVRDVADLRRSGLPVFALGSCPAGPHKGWGGTINGVVQVGGCPVSPGDIVVGDEDGLAIVPGSLAEDGLAALRARCLARMERETEILAALDRGLTTVDLLKLPAAGDYVGR